MIQRVEIALGGYTTDPNDPLTTTGPSIISQKLLEGPVKKERIEDLQIWSALESLGIHGALQHPVAMRPGEDPPDRVITAGGKECSIELTGLTLFDMRQNLARARRVERLVQAGIAQDLSLYSHLNGCTVTIMSLNDSLPAGVDYDSVSRQILTSIQTDNGALEDNLDAATVAAEGFPDQLSINKGHYGNHEGLEVQVNRNPMLEAQQLSVVASTPISYHMSELRDLFIGLVSKKDIVQNRALLVTTGLPDTSGYVCPSDRWLFGSIIENGLDGKLAPKYLDAVLLHQFATTNIVEVYRRPGAALPWSPAPKKEDV